MMVDGAGGGGGVVDDGNVVSLCNFINLFIKIGTAFNGIHSGKP